MDCSTPGSSVHGISQARTLEWVAISFSRVSSWLRDLTGIFCLGRGILYHWATWEAQVAVASLQLLPLSSHGVFSVSQFSPRIKYQSYWIRVYSKELILSELHLQRSYSQIRSYSQVSEAGTSTYFQGSSPQPFYYQGLVSRKTIFPQMRRGRQMVSGWFELISLLLIWQEAELRWLCEQQSMTVNTYEASLTCLTLTSWCGVQLLTSHRLIQSVARGLGSSVLGEHNSTHNKHLLRDYVPEEKRFKRSHDQLKARFCLSQGRYTRCNGVSLENPQSTPRAKSLI